MPEVHNGPRLFRPVEIDGAFAGLFGDVDDDPALNGVGRFGAAFEGAADPDPPATAGTAAPAPTAGAGPPLFVAALPPPVPLFCPLTVLLAAASSSGYRSRPASDSARCR